MVDAEEAGRDLFTQELMAAVSPAEIPLIPDYRAAINAKVNRARAGGLEFGLEDALVALGPLVVFVGQKLFNDLGEWAISNAEVVIKEYIVKGAQQFLRKWLSQPQKGGLNDVLTEKGKEEIINKITNYLEENKKIPQESIHKIVEALRHQLFEL